MTRPVRATIDLAALAYNLSVARNVAPNSKVMAVIKANAYGHGIVEAATALAQADMFAVASLEEALTLIGAGIQPPIVLLEGVFEKSELQIAIDNNIQIVIHDYAQIRWIEQSDLKGCLTAWVKIDTGMHRLGFSPDDYEQVMLSVTKIPSISPNPGLMSHFACADEPERKENHFQSECFRKMANNHVGEKSLSNSAALLSRIDDQYDWVRPGIMLYGSSPFNSPDRCNYPILKPVMCLSTKLIATRACVKGEAIGYGGSYICERDMTIGVAAIGYGDGYPRHAPTGTPVFVDGKCCSLVGRVSMDMITIDLGDDSSASSESDVELWGNQLSVDEVARHTDTISYELLCNITPRVNRHYINTESG